MKVRYLKKFETFSDKAIDMVLDSAVGKTFKDSEGESIGTIVEANRGEEPKVVEIVIEIPDEAIQ